MGKNRKALIVLAVVILALAIPYFAFDRESTTLTQTVRERLPGKFVSLSDGYTHYQWAGPETGPVVVLVHGFSTPLFNWDRNVPALTAAGFRVLRYDLFGRGFSDRPYTDYNEDLFDRQLMELLGALKVNGPIRLVGLSMGGAIVTIFSARHPEKVEKLVLIAPAGFPVTLPFTSKLVKVPMLGGYIMKAVGDRSLIKSVTKSLFKPERVPEYMDKYQEQMIYKGYKRAIVSTLRHFDLHNQQAAFEAAGKHPRPVLLFWGKEDAIVPFEHSARVLTAMPKARLVAIDDSGHVCQYETPEAVNAELVRFLTR
ncbi:MAG: alpha/beta hydrolase [Desulfobacterales bacterium]|nr:alpha/beta hydrolase [Desulfobacterales bacterium]